MIIMKVNSAICDELLLIIILFKINMSSYIPPLVLLYQRFTSTNVAALFDYANQSVDTLYHD